MKLRQIAKIAAFNLVLLLVLLELAGLAAYAWRTRSLYYTNPPTGRSVAETLSGVVEAYRIHPFLGFIIRPSATVARNDAPHNYNALGFDSPYELPYTPPHADGLVVAITGGSAAAHLATFENREGLLADYLSQALGLAEADRVTVLNLAQGGFKQPQQLLIYQYLRALGQRIDLVINFDGFNEVALGLANRRAGVSVDMPSIEHVRALQEVTLRTNDTAGLEAMVEARRRWRNYSRRFNHAWSGDAWETKFAGGFLVHYVLYRIDHQRYDRLRAEVADPGRAPTGSGASWLYLNPTRGEAPQDDLDTSLDAALDLWRNSTRLLWQATQADGAAYLHVVQPNQYHDTARQFDEAEQRVALNPLSPYRERIAAGYPRLAEAVETLRREGLPVEAPLTLLDTVPEAVYIDDCCHFTDAGQTVLLEHIAPRALAALRRSGRIDTESSDHGSTTASEGGPTPASSNR